MDARLHRIIESLRHASAFLEKLKTERIPTEVTLPREVAAISLLRLDALLPSVISLLSAGDALAVEPIVRTLFEVVLNVGWIGADEGRAQRFKNEGLQAAQKWFAERNKAGVVIPSPSQEWLQQWFAERSTHGGMPDRRTRAMSVSLETERFKISGLPSAYVEYQRLCASSHADYWHLHAFATSSEPVVVLDAQGAAAAVMFALMLAAEPLGFGANADPVVMELRDALEASTSA